MADIYNTYIHPLYLFTSFVALAFYWKTESVFLSSKLEYFLTFWPGNHSQKDRSLYSQYVKYIYVPPGCMHFFCGLALKLED